MTVQEIITQVRTLLDEDTAELWTDAQILVQVQDADDEIYTALADREIWVFAKYIDYDFVADQSLYPLPGDFYKKIEVLDLSATPDLPTADIHPSLRWQWEIMAGQPRPSYVQGNYIGFTPTPTTAESSQRRLWYAPHPARLTTGTATAGTADTITLGLTATTTTLGTTSSADDAYNARLFGIHSGISAGDVIVVEDYVGSTRLLTSETDFSDTPTTASTYCLMPITPQPFHKALVYYGGAHCLLRDSDPMSEFFMAKYEQVKQELFWNLRHRTTRFGPAIRRRPRYAI